LNFKNNVEVSLETVKAFVLEAKRCGFAATDTKTTLSDQTSVYSYRPFADARFAGMIYADTYSGNTIEGGHESVTVDLVLRWRNQYYGGTNGAFWDTSNSTLGPAYQAVASRFPEVVSSFLKQALMNLPTEFPVRGPREFLSDEVAFEDVLYRGEWRYENRWMPISLFPTSDPFAAFAGQERIYLNGREVYWHAYQGGLIRDKYFPSVLA